MKKGHQKGEEHHAWKGHEEIPGKFWYVIKKGAIDRNLEFSIDIESCWNMFLNQDRKCAISGLDITFEGMWKNKQTASLDRIDSSKGYINGNIQWVHKDINKIKNAFDESYFIYLCSKIIENKNFSKKALDYQHISLVPRVISTLEHRSDAKPGTNFNGIPLELALISAPMPDVTDGRMAYELNQNGCMSLIHRFQSLEEQIKEFKIGSVMSSKIVGCAIGTTLDWKERLEELLKVNCSLFCIDTANGANKQVEKVVEELKKYKTTIIAGNVASKECFKYLADLGVHGIRVGIAGGSVCETKNETSIFHPMASLILEVSEYKKNNNYQTAIIADGGIKLPADFCKALALGADLVMVGGLFSSCKESPAKTLKIEGKIFKVLRGAASFSVQQEFKDEPKYVEGRETLIPYSGPVSELIQRFRYGLESSMSYMDSRTLEEFRKKVRWVEV